MILKLSFDKEDEKLPAKLYFTGKQIALLHIVGKKCEGSFQKVESCLHLIIKYLCIYNSQY